MEAPKVTNIRSQQGDYRSLRLDYLNHVQLKHLQDYWLRAANQNISQTVLVRRALDHYVNVVDELGTKEAITGELNSLKDRAEGSTSQISLEPVNPMETWKPFNERIVIPALNLLKGNIKKRKEK